MRIGKRENLTVNSVSLLLRFTVYLYCSLLSASRFLQALRFAKEGGGILRTRLLLLHHVERVLDVLDRLQATLFWAPPRGRSLSNNRDGANDLRVHARALAALLRTTLKYA
eukprot:GHVU01215334.1.p1 GENE.GHVU01215334.1~~GHVU01215334.1.p1  ORF type:complete len:111 (+),score=5.81 GHVU01215334.1:763-1095(+)